MTYVVREIGGMVPYMQHTNLVIVQQGRRSTYNAATSTCTHLRHDMPPRGNYSSSMDLKKLTFWKSTQSCEKQSYNCGASIPPRNVMYIPI